MNKKGSNHLTINERKIIEEGLKDNLSCKVIADLISFDARTVSREVKNKRKKEPNGKYGTYGKFDETECKILLRFPFVCNGCDRKRFCFRKHKFIYSANYAQETYKLILKDSRCGLDILPEDKKVFDEILLQGVKNGQSIHHIIETNKDKLRYCERSTYRLIDKGLTPIKALDLPRKAKFKPRKHYVYKEDNKFIRQGRTYADFIKLYNSMGYISVTQIDTVLATNSANHKCLLTIHISATHFMLIYVLDKKSKDEVSRIFLYLQNVLGTTLYKRLFPIILTDRGTEFCNPNAIELNYSNKEEKLTNLFYCNSYSSYQKGAIEENHTLLRRIIPKSILFDNLTQDKADLIASHINSYYRKSIGGCPYDLTKECLGEEIIKRLNMTKIAPKDIIFKPTLLK